VTRVLRSLLPWAACALCAAGPAAGRPDQRTETWKLSALDAESAILLLERLQVLGPTGRLAAHPREPRTILVEGAPAELRAARSLLAELDKASRAELRIYVRPVMHLLPSRLAQELEAVFGRFGSRSAGQAPLFVVPDDSTAQLVVRTSRERYLVLDKLARRLDVAPSHRRLRVLTPVPEGFP
jgi:type II secretory pathway component GspD/PulD (secretin)